MTRAAFDVDRDRRRRQRPGRRRRAGARPGCACCCSSAARRSAARAAWSSSRPGFRAAPLGHRSRLAAAADRARARPRRRSSRAAADAPLAVARRAGRVPHALARRRRGPPRRSGAHSRGRRGEVAGVHRAPRTRSPDSSRRSTRRRRPTSTRRSLGELLRAARARRAKFRGLGRADMIEFLRTLPMSVWELLDDWFECAPLKAAVAAGGIQDHQQGPRSGGTGFVLLHHLVGAPAGSVRGRVPWRGGPDAFTRRRRSAPRGGRRRRSAPAPRSRASSCRTTRSPAWCSRAARRSPRAPCSRPPIPRAPCSTGSTRCGSIPSSCTRSRNIRYRGCTAVVLYALDALPAVPGLAAARRSPASCRSRRALVALERAADAAKYGTVSERPHVELTVPTLLLARARARRASTCWSRASSTRPTACATARPGTPRAREALADARDRGDRGGARPASRSRVLHRVALVAARSRGALRAARGRGVAGRAGARPDTVHAAGRGLGPPRHADRGPLPGRRRHPSRARHPGRPGMARRAAAARRRQRRQRSSHDRRSSATTDDLPAGRAHPARRVLHLGGDPGRGARADLRARLELRRPRGARSRSRATTSSREVAGESIIVLRDREGALRAFFNVCRHRGTRICREESGRFAETIQCPYHAWTYGTDGRLVGAPHMQDVRGLRQGRLPAARRGARRVGRLPVREHRRATPEPFEPRGRR